MGRQMRRIAVLTSGGDAPGMNAAVRAAVRVGLDRGCETFGVRHGFTGLMTGDFIALGARSVGGIIQQGGTILGSTRCDEFRTEAGRRRALDCLERHDIDGLVVIGGNGSQRGSHLLAEFGFPVVGVASTIDNDLAGSDITLGVDTALNVALEAIDRLKTTASSHHRAFVVEVMGRDCGYLALMAGIAGGAEAIAIPEVETRPEVVAAEVRAPISAARPTPSSSSPSMPPVTPNIWSATSRRTARISVSSSASPSSATSSAEALPEPSIGSSVRVLERRPCNR